MMMEGNEWHGEYTPFALSGRRSGAVAQLVIRSPIRMAQTNDYGIEMEQDVLGLRLTWNRRGSEAGVFDPLALMRLRKLSNDEELQSCLFPFPWITVPALWTTATTNSIENYIRAVGDVRDADLRQCCIQHALLLPAALTNTLFQPIIQCGLNDRDAGVRSNTVELIEWLKHLPEGSTGHEAHPLPTPVAPTKERQ